MDAAAGRRSGHATLEDFLAIPEGERFHELIGGEIVQKAAPLPEHGGAQFQVASSLGPPFGRRPPGGPPDRPGGWWLVTEVEVQIGPNVYRPDALGWRRERVQARPTGSPVKVLPDWICEIISPGNASHDTVTKMNAYHAAQVPHYWLLDPSEQTLQVYRWHKDGYLQVLAAKGGDRVRAEPFDAIELSVGVLFGEDEESL
jgi:Uma2 family endonuclease